MRQFHPIEAHRGDHTQQVFLTIIPLVITVAPVEAWSNWEEIELNGEPSRAAPTVSLDAPLDLRADGASDLLKDLQGNILKSHARDHAAHLLVRFPAEPAAARAWVADFATTQVTSAAGQMAQIDEHKSGRDSGGFAMIALSSAGYDALDRAAIKPADPRFRNGLKRSDLAASDPPVAAWEPPYRDDLHAIVVLADQDRARLAATVATVTASLAAINATAQVEMGDTIPFEDPVYGRQTHVHFGFADGLSQPETILQDIEREVAAHGDAHWNPGGPLKLLLARGPDGGLGSYFVFRKLEQDVRGFQEAERALVAALGLAPDEAALAEAMIVGRRRNGDAAIPARRADDGGQPRPGNDFNFDDDRFGVMCPFHTHIRRSNPRGDLASPGVGRPPLPLEVERGFRIARRGIPYGAADYLESADISTYPRTGVGLLFMCFQADLQQFEIQQAGSDTNDFPLPQVGVDATIGRVDRPVPQHWYFPSGSTGTPGPQVSDAGELRFAIANFVTLKGGEYFYAPGLGFLRSLAA